MENHLQRKEIQKALKEGYGSARRRSGTLNKSMLYVSYMSKNKDYILRIAMPFNGYVSYLVILLPSILLSLE